jgi:hypothetical protein
MPDTLDKTIGGLLLADDDSLLEQLGIYVKANVARQAAVVEYAPTITHDEKMMGPLDDVRALGRRVLARWNRELFQVMCGSAAGDQKERESLLKAIGVSDVAIASALTALLVTWGVAAAIATLIAALVVKRIISPAGKEFCAFWGEKLGEG